MGKNPDPTLLEVQQSFGANSSASPPIAGSTIIKTCPSGDYDRDNYCGINKAWTTFYTADE